MKLSRILPLAILPVAFGLMTSCDSTSSSSGPSITNLYIDPASLTAGSGSSGIHASVTSEKTGMAVVFKVSQGSTDLTSNFTITYSNPTSTASSWSAYNDGNASIAAKSTAANGTYTLTLTVTDANGTATQSATFTVGGGSTGTATTEHTGTVNNRFGPNTGAWSLSGDSAVHAATADSKKDLRDALTSATSGVFDGSMISPSGAQIVSASTSFTYSTSLTKEQIAAGFTAGMAVSSIDMPVVGEIYILKLTDNTYVALKITAVVEGSTTVGNNTGSVSFSYRK